MDITATQQRLVEQNLDGWLLYDFRRSNDIACGLLGISPQALVTRRFFYWIPKAGSPIKISHRIERHVLASLPGEDRPYATWHELENTLKEVLSGSKTIAMEYSPKNALPYISKVDGGTIEQISSFGLSIVSSANLIATPWTATQIALHLEAADFLDKTADKTWKWIAQQLHSSTPLTEWGVQAFITNEFTTHNFTADDGALCAVNANSANPHYHAQQNRHSPIKPGDFILIDLSCRKNTPDGVFADITRVAIAAPTPTPKQKAIFDIVRHAQQTATDFVRQRIEADQPIAGYEVDDACRQVINAAGYGTHFIHRTGHNLDLLVHGPGTHMDNFETHDTRPILPNTCFTIEPGIYLPNEFGIRLEYDILILPNSQIQITGGTQHSIVTL